MLDEHNIPAAEQEQLTHFIETGECPPAFEAVIERSPAISQIMDQVIQRQDEGFKRLADELYNERNKFKDRGFEVIVPTVQKKAR